MMPRPPPQVENPVASQYDVLSKAADLVGNRLGRAAVGVVLGSGLSEVLESLDQAQFLEYTDIPGMPAPTTVGHRGALLYGRTSGGVPVLALCGRIHLYEGRPLEDLSAGIRLLSLLGVHTLVVTSAVGSLLPTSPPGHMVLIEDHINLSGTNVLSGPHDPRFGPRFTDLTQAYDADLLNVMEKTAKQVGVPLERSILVQTSGPSYETPAEVRLAKSVGAGVVSMSMVPDVLTARQRGMRVVGLGCVTNMAAGMSPNPLDHEEVLLHSAEISANLQLLLSGALAPLSQSAQPGT
ncbi:MAG: purine-nucleoside phosphorylase [Pseudohongiellaceae bacterium]|jgi:purine-nucleoside phosphorylase